jgi:NAD(P)-dependent dehydrogenase (short-subunit alcohol dehydrogenase family)
MAKFSTAAAAALAARRQQVIVPALFSRSATAELVTKGLDLAGKTYFVTGITSGVGKETARVLLLRNANVIGTGRSLADAEKTRQELKTITKAQGELIPIECQLADVKSIRNCINQVKQYRSIDGIVANA